MYWISDEPEDISSFTFVGKDIKRRYPCNRTTYNYFRQDRKGKLYMAGTGKIVTAPYYYIGEPGEQKAAIALEDSVFMNVIRTDKTTLNETYEDILVPDKRAIIYHEYKLIETEEKRRG